MLDQQTGQPAVWLDDRACDLEAFKRHVAQETLAADYPHASEIANKIPLYDGDAMRRAMADPAQARLVMAEWNRAFLSGPGIIAIRKGYDDPALVDAVTEQLNAIIREEEVGSTGKGDHFAAAGANSRVWNAHEKLCMQAPEVYVRYNANELTRRVSESWLGSGYQITFQANVVRPGGKAQVAHRDYHMGFQDVETLKGYPASQHALSAALTLQGAVAHSDMPLASGPTKLLPYSQSYLPGYIAVLLPQFRAFFEEACVQLPLAKGDMLFFNPATFHAAGDNTTADIQRFANLMQIGSAYGRSIEIVDRSRITLAAYEDLKALLAAGRLSAREGDNVVAATAEGYPFPANLDIDSPLSGMAPPSQQDVLRQALAEGWDLARLTQAIAEQDGRKRSH
ncbi:MAG: phytanoyl-CoA dioxygenase [Rhodobacteraceae bacterium]|nr:MAG: phytanoyl-CoA dioxygenase [Paracoccaceae bacterium]